MTGSPPRGRQLDRPRVGAAVAIVLGTLAVAAATVVGWNEGWLDVVVAPPPIVRASLVGGSVVLGGWLLVRSVSRMATASSADVRTVIRAVRLAFLAVAAWAAAAGWLLAHPLPLIVAAIIAGIDVIETSLLLLVVGRG
jgi:hypothetical protein